MRTTLLASALLSLALVTGCSGSDGETAAPSGPSASASPSDSPATASTGASAPLTTRQVAGALPSVEDVPDADGQVFRCRFGTVTPDCPREHGRPYASATFALDGTRSKTDEETRQGTFWLYERAQVKALQYDDAASAARALARDRATDRKSTGKLDLAAQDTGNGSFSLGLTGTAVLQAYATSTGPRGYAYTRDFRYTTPAGTTSAPYDSAYLAVTRDRYLVAVDVQRWRKHGRADELAHELLERYLADLS